MDTNEAFCCPRIAERTRFHRDREREWERVRERERGRETQTSQTCWMNSGLRKEKPANSFCKISFVIPIFGFFLMWPTITITLPQGHVYQQLAHVQHRHLVKVHHEELVCGCQLRALARKLSVKVRDVFSMPLGTKMILNQIHFFTENPNNWNGWYIQGLSHVKDDCHAIFSTVYIEKVDLSKLKRTNWKHFCFLPATSKNYNSSEAPNSGLAKLNPANSLPLRLERM